MLRSINYFFYLSLIVFAYLIVKVYQSYFLLHQLFALLALIGVFIWGDHLTIYHFALIWSLPVSLIIFKKNSLAKKLKPVYFNFFIVILVLSLVIYKLFIVKPKINLPYYFHYQNALITDLSNYGSWLDLQLWSDVNTPVSAVFLTPPYLSGFRNFSQRSIIGDYKDGGVIFYSSTYAHTWQQRMTDLKEFNQFNAKDFKKLQQKYFFNYLVVVNNHSELDFDLIYQNQNFRLYQL